MKHIPVMLDEAMRALEPAKGKSFVDATFGAGGHSRALLAAGAEVIALDRDPFTERAARIAESENPALSFHLAPFSRMGEIVQKEVDGVLLDLGVSSMQIDQAERGFSFRFDGPLDMRMDPGAGKSAADIVNHADEAELARILAEYGDVRRARATARKIASARPLGTTRDLAAICGEKEKAQIFQAIRIAVNGELAEISAGIAASAKILKRGGRLAVITFHSIEDRTVKNLLRPRATANRYDPGGGRYTTGDNGNGSLAADRYATRDGRYSTGDGSLAGGRYSTGDGSNGSSADDRYAKEGTESLWRALYKHALKPSKEEISRNPRAASAKLRAAVRI
jgi:16S rRNA (cytosine1402-N4)-methyltransferase